jgi:hypothetical protein
MFSLNLKIDTLIDGWLGMEGFSHRCAHSARAEGYHDNKQACRQKRAFLDVKNDAVYITDS